MTDSDKDNVSEKLNAVIQEIKDFESMHPDGIPTLAEVHNTSSPKLEDIHDLDRYYINLTIVKYLTQLIDISSNKKEKADNVIKAYREVFGIAQKIKKECEEVWEVYAEACRTLISVPSEKSAQMAINAADFCAKVGRIDDAKKIYREVIITYTGFIYKPYVKQAEFGLEDLREREQQKKKASKRK